MRIRISAIIISTLIVGLSLFTSNCESGRESKTATDTGQEVSDSIYLARGQMIAGSTFQALSGQLQQAMKSGGVIEAVSVCQLAANPIVDSLANVHQADIRRTALRVRNPNNTASEAERTILEGYQSALAQKTPLKPNLVDLGNGQVAFYAPIIAADLCLKCHGSVGETLNKQDYTHIQHLYPDDQAIGFQAGDLRGIWSIRMAKTSIAN